MIGLDLKCINDQLELIEMRLSLFPTIKRRLNHRAQRAGSNMRRRLRRSRKVRDVNSHANGKRLR